MADDPCPHPVAARVTAELRRGADGLLYRIRHPGWIAMCRDCGNILTDTGQWIEGGS